MELGEFSHWVYSFFGGLFEVEVYNAAKTMTLLSMQWRPPMLQQMIDYLR
jgi:hypothetical protein